MTLRDKRSKVCEYPLLLISADKASDLQNGGCVDNPNGRLGHLKGGQRSALSMSYKSESLTFRYDNTSGRLIRSSSSADTNVFAVDEP